MIKKILILIFSFLQVVLINVQGIGNITPEELFRDGRVPEPRILPADYTFAVWAFIYPTCIAYAIYLLFFQKNNNSLADKLSNNALAIFFVFTIYAVLARFIETEIFTALVIIIPYYFLIKNLLIIKNNLAISKTDYYFSVPAFSVYGLWISVAIFVNTASSLMKLNYLGWPLNEVIWAILGLLIAACVISFMIAKTKNNWYYGASLWAFTGVAVGGFIKQYYEVPVVAVIAILMISYFFLKARMRKNQENQFV
jgi:hypothetical protein